MSRHLFSVNYGQAASRHSTRQFKFLFWLSRATLVFHINKKVLQTFSFRFVFLDLFASQLVMKSVFVRLQWATSQLSHLSLWFFCWQQFSFTRNSRGHRQQLLLFFLSCKRCEWKTDRVTNRSTQKNVYLFQRNSRWELVRWASKETTSLVEF